MAKGLYSVWVPPSSPVPEPIEELGHPFLEWERGPPAKTPETGFIPGKSRNLGKFRQTSLSLP